MEGQGQCSSSSAASLHPNDHQYAAVPPSESDSSDSDSDSSDSEASVEFVDSDDDPDSGDSDDDVEDEEDSEVEEDADESEQEDNVEAKPANGAVKTAEAGSKEEAQMLEARKQAAEREEKEAQRQVIAREKEFKDIERNRKLGRAEEARSRQPILRRISKLEEAIEKERSSLHELDEKVEEREREFHKNKKCLEQHRRWSAAKKRARIAAARAVDEHPFNQAHSYSRACTICLNANPRERVVMVVCGHMTCAICAEELEQTSASIVACPFCRKQTAYVKLFEASEEPKEPVASLKRKATMPIDLALD